MNRRFFWQAIVGILIGIITTTTIVWGATYNFYFTNTEQGNNSTATPSVIVSDGKAVSTGASPGPAPLAANGVMPGASPVPTSLPASLPSSVPSPTPVTSPTPAITPDVAVVPPVASPNAETVAEFAPPRLRHWELALDATGRYSLGAGNYVGLGYGAEFDLGYHFTRDLALVGFVGLNTTQISGWDMLHGGLDFQLVPLHISFGRFNDVIDLGVLAGVSTIAAVPGNFVTVHGGARVDVNLGDRWSVTGLARLNAGYVMFSTGVSIHI